MPPTIPRNLIVDRVTEMFEHIKQEMKRIRDHWLAGATLNLQGWMSNRLGRGLDQSAAGKGAMVTRLTTTLGFHVVSELHLPVISNLTSACELGIDKLIEHFQKKALKSAFDVDDVGPDKDEAEIMKQQGEYVVLKVAQAVVDAVRKVKESYNKAEAARKNVKDCESFYTYLVACSYLDYRIARLDYYNSMLQTWAENVGGQLKVLNAQWDLLEHQLHDTAAVLVGDYALHLRHCMGQQYCLFKEEWLHQYVVSEPTLLKQAGTPSNVPPGAPAQRVSPAPTPGAGWPVPKIQKPGPPTKPGVPPVKWNR